MVEGAEVTVVCDEGYELKGGATSFAAQCVDGGLGGEYNKGAPVCVEKPGTYSQSLIYSDVTFRIMVNVIGR